MASGTDIPYIYSDKANLVSPKDWNNVMLRDNSQEDLDTTADSPYTPDFTVREFRIDADSADFEFNLPALSSITHPNISGYKVNYRITNISTSLYNVNVNPNGTDLLGGLNATVTLLPGETLDITSGTGGWT